MAYEFFDDVAFYFSITCFLFVFLAPWTAYKIYDKFFAASTSAKCTKATDPLCFCEDCQGAFKKVKKVQKDSKAFSRHFTFGNILFFFMWIAFLVLVVQLPSMQTEELTTFDPYGILGIEKDATDGQIKKAYRSESLKWHPDKNQDNPEAEQKFIMVAKAYQTLTDEAAKENLDKFGNPDGYQGMSMTIGLPSFLTEKENELPVLMLYFLILIVIPPIGVWMWWSKAKHIHQSGLHHQTMYQFNKLVTARMAPKFLIEILAASAEFKSLGLLTQNSKAALENLKKLTKEKQVSQKFKKGYVVKGTTLIYAYLMRLKIDATLKDDLLLVLKNSHRLLQVMLEMCVLKKFVIVMQSVLAFMKHLSQALWFGAHPLQQLPILEQRDINKLIKSGLSTLDKFKQSDQQKREKACPHIQPEQWQEIDAAAARLPSVQLDVSYSVDGEEGFYAGDTVKLVVNMKRKTLEEIRGGSVAKKEEQKKAKEEQEYVDDIEELIEILPVQKKRIPEQKNHVYAYTPYFPFDKKENWYLYVMDTTIRQKPRFVSFKKIATFGTEESLDLYFPLTRHGSHVFEVYAMCDAYIGCDRRRMFSLQVGKKVDLEKKIEARKAEEESDEDSDDDEEEGEMSPWWDVLVLILLAIIAYNWLQSKGYWAQYADPIIEKITVLFAPLTQKVYPHIKPVWDPLVASITNTYASLGDMLTREIPVEEPDY